VNAETIAHDLYDLRCRSRYTVGVRIRQIASDALDALCLDTPRPDFSKQYLAQLLAAIDAYTDTLSTQPQT
jgi:hypothetical protein